MKTYDDHVWIIAGGTAWAIRAIREGGKTFDLWRGREPNIVYATLDASAVDWARYCDAATTMLERPRG